MAETALPRNTGQGSVKLDAGTSGKRRLLGPTYDERITLITCWPYVSNTHRAVVVAEPDA